MIRVVTRSALRMCAEHVRRLALLTGQKVWLYEGTEGADLHATSVEEPQRKLIGTYNEAAPVDWIEQDLLTHIGACAEGT